MTTLENESATPHRSYQVLLCSVFDLDITTTTKPCLAISHLAKFVDMPNVEHVNTTKSFNIYLMDNVELRLVLDNCIRNNQSHRPKYI